MIRKYAPEDLPMWGDWLVYGTALGVGDKVEQAMKVLNIPVAETGVPMGVMGMNAFFMPIVTFMPMIQGGPGVASAEGALAADLAEEEGSVAAGPGDGELARQCALSHPIPSGRESDFSLFKGEKRYKSASIQ